MLEFTQEEKIKLFKELANTDPDSVKELELYDAVRAMLAKHGSNQMQTVPGKVSGVGQVIRAGEAPKE